MPENELTREITCQLEYLKNRARKDLSLDLNQEQLTKFCLYAQLLLKWNEKVNLTAITHPRDIAIKHFLDSLVIVQWIKKYYISPDILLADLGTGAGFPGIPIKIVLPEVKVVLIDALAKRISFLDEVISSLDLTGIDTFHARAEDAGRDSGYREVFDAVTARAVAELPVLLEYASPLLKVGGLLFSAKGLDPEQELKAAQKALQTLNCKYEHLEKYSLGEGAEYRSLIIIKKHDHTPAKFPRQAGKPKKNPL